MGDGEEVCRWPCQFVALPILKGVRWLPQRSVLRQGSVAVKTTRSTQPAGDFRERACGLDEYFHGEMENVGSKHNHSSNHDKDFFTVSATRRSS